MESALLSFAPIFSSSKAPRPHHAYSLRPHLSQCSIRRSGVRASNFHQSKEFFAIPLPAAVSRQSALSASSSFRALASGGGADGESKDVMDSSAGLITLDVTGMMCDGCVAGVTKILESQPQVSSAKVSLQTATAVVCATPDAQLIQNWQKDLGERLANHLTNCGFKSNLRG
ncbi:hypothetical protein ACLOJK_016248 [Asimina triloba]